MKLTELAREAQLTQITIDDEDIVKKYGEAIDFWVKDRQPMDIFLKLATIDKDNMNDIIEVMSAMILDEEGNKVIDEKNILPMDILMRVVGKVVATLGNESVQTSAA